MSVYVRLLPAVTGSTSSALVAERSAAVLTSVFSVSLLFPGQGSLVELATVTVFLIVVPLAVFAFTFTTSVNVAVLPEASVAVLQLTVPVPPTDGLLQVKAGPLV